MKKGVEAPPSTCISWYFFPSFSTSIITGGKTPGTLAEATSTLRNRSRACSPPRWAMAPMSQMTVSSRSRLVVATSSMRPFGGFARDGEDEFVGDEALDEIAQRLAVEHADIEQDAEAARLHQVVGGVAAIGFGELAVPVGAEEGERRDQGAGRDAGDDLEARARAGIGEADEDARAIGAAGAAAGQGQHVDRAVRVPRWRGPTRGVLPC